MLLLRFLRFVFGYVGFTAQGGFPERFINLCRHNKIILWELKSRNGVISACVDREGYKKIRPVARKSGMRVRIRRKYGLPFFLARHSRRVGVLIGACLCAAVLLILSTRIWSIDVIGNVRVSAETVLGVFEELGVRRGVAGSRINISATEIEALRRLPELSWLNINISGSAALIEVRETVKSPELAENGEPTDIVAARDGQIVILRPFNGTQEQKIGNPVLKGDLLISGIEQNKDLTVSFCKASGYVVARTNREITAAQSAKFKAKKAVSQNKSYVLDFLFFSIPLGRQVEDAYSEKSELYINGVTLPVGLTERTQTVYEETEITLSQAQTRLLAQLRFFKNSSEDFRYLQVEQSEITADDQSGCTVSGKFTCLENIGLERPMQIEEINS